MNWINNVVRPKIRGLLSSTTKREVPDNLWVKCPESGQMVFYKDLEANEFVVPGSDYHMRMGADQRLKHLFDGGTYTSVSVPGVPQDPLKFRDGRKYTDRLKAAKSETELEDAVLVGEGLLEGQQVVAAAQDFRFMAGSLGMAAGEAVIAGMLRAVELKTPFILFAASGGARMQEGILSLMQMPRTTITVEKLREAKLPYIVVLTDPTTGGVTASYAMLGDIHIAEPGALICFAGPRVIQQTIREQLPDGFQRSEYLLAHGMVDMVVHRHKLRETLARICRLIMTGVNAGKGTGKRINGHHYMNGSPVDSKLIETAARETGGVIEPEPVPQSQRFEPRTEKAKRDSDTAGTHHVAPKDASRSA
ncbi:MAG: acetyl-CoA carboxylase carboxyltransferase subunit beta [Hyphomicrobium sp.]|nr:acetyl-CoA carboxylase carboxyltransferase subunit beta [Hyphomicrobium sp.]